jgi:hypothetical protein
MLQARAETNWRGEPQPALRQYAEQALALGPAVDLETRLHLTLARCCADEGDLVEARSHAEAAHRLSQRLGSPLLIGLAQAADGTILARTGTIGEGGARFERAVATLERARLPFERAQTLEVWADELRARGERQQARPLLAEALQVFEALGARPAADRCRALLNALRS